MLIAASRRLESLYMIPALCRLALFPRVTIIPVVAEQQANVEQDGPAGGGRAHHHETPAARPGQRRLGRP